MLLSSEYVSVYFGKGCRAMEPTGKKEQWVRGLVGVGRVLLKSVHLGNKTSSELEIKPFLTCSPNPAPIASTIVCVSIWSRAASLCS